MRQDVTILSAFSIWKPKLATVRGSAWYSADVVIVGCVCNKDRVILTMQAQTSRHLMQAKTSHHLIQAQTSHILTKTSHLSYRQKTVTTHIGKKQSTLIGKLYNLEG